MSRISFISEHGGGLGEAAFRRKCRQWSECGFGEAEEALTECRSTWEHDCREKVRPGTGREAGLGHAGGRATQGAVAEGNETP